MSFAVIAAVVLLLGVAQAQEPPECDFSYPTKGLKKLTIVEMRGILHASNLTFPAAPGSGALFSARVPFFEYENFTNPDGEMGDFLMTLLLTGMYINNQDVFESATFVDADNDYMTIMGGGPFSLTPPACFTKPVTGGSGKYLGATGVCFARLAFFDMELNGGMWVKCYYKTWPTADRA